MIAIQDYSSWDTYDGASEGSGRSEKVWLISPDGTIGLFKFPKIDPTTSQETTEHVSEHLAHQIGQVLEIPTANVDIGIYEHRIGSMSYLVREPHESLTEGISFISRLFPSYDADQMIDPATQMYYCLEHIFQSTADFVPQKDWLEMMVFDFLIGNADRHQSNWAILTRSFDPTQKQAAVRRCPLYDNGSSLCCYVNNNQLDKMFGKDPGPFNALVDTKSRSIIRIDGSRKAQPKHREVVEHLLMRYPETHDICCKFLSSLNYNIIDTLLNEYPAEILSPKKNELIRRFLKKKLDILGEIVRG